MSLSLFGSCDITVCNIIECRFEAVINSVDPRHIFYGSFSFLRDRIKSFSNKFGIWNSGLFCSANLRQKPFSVGDGSPVPRRKEFFVKFGMRNAEFGIIYVSRITVKMQRMVSRTVP